MPHLSITLTAAEVYNLDCELTGGVNLISQSFITTGILKQKMSNVQKFWLNDLKLEIKPYKENLDQTRNDLIGRLGEISQTGVPSIPYTVPKKDEQGNPVMDGDKPVMETNPNLLEYTRQLEEVLSQQITIQYHPFKLEDYTFDTEDSYPTFYKLIKHAMEAAETAEVVN